MYRDELQKLEGVWVGTERGTDAGQLFEAQTRLVFQTVFDGKFLVCDYVQSAGPGAASVGHGVFRKDDRTDALSVSWFRSPVATGSQQTEAVAEGDRMIFVETIDGRSTRATYTVAFDKLTVRTETSLRGGEWTTILEGTFRRR